MRLKEFSSPLNLYLVTVKVRSTSVKTLIHSESQSHARLLLGKIFGKDNVQSINSISTNESQNTISLNLREAVNADNLVSLWQIVSQNVFDAVEKERREQEQAIKQKKNPKVAPKFKQPPKPTIVSPQPSKAKKTSAQEIQRQNVQSNNVRSKPKKTSAPSSSATAVTAKNQSKRVTHNPNSVANIQRQLDPLAFDPTIKKLTS
jgi:FtsZ-interacting cell division protein YlmF